jgi:hypothetical protein
LPEALVVEEVEELVLDDRTTDIEAELVAIEGRLLKGYREAGVADERRLEEAGSIQVGVAQKFIDRRVQLIGSALGGDVDRRTRASPIFRALVIGHDLKLRDRVGRNGDDLIIEALIRLTVGVVIDAVEQIVVEYRTLAVDVERAGAHQRVAGGDKDLFGRLARARHQCQ